jgi:hypothetical protein
MKSRAVTSESGIVDIWVYLRLFVERIAGRYLVAKDMWVGG